MKKISTVIFLTVYSGLFYSFSHQEGAEYRQRNYFDAKCDCYVHEVYFPSGKLFISEQFSDSSIQNNHGKSIYFYETGDTAEVTIFVDGKMEGYSYNKNTNGVIISGRYYSNGRLDTLMSYDEEGTLEETTIYSDIKRTKIDEYSVMKHLPNGDGYVVTDNYKLYKSKFKETVVNSFLYSGMHDIIAKRTGRQIFTQNCASCHNPYKDVVGPKLVGITNRRSYKWIRSWIRNSAKMIADGDKQAVALYSEWHETAMTSFPDLSKEDMNKLMDYLASL